MLRNRYFLHSYKPSQATIHSLLALVFEEELKALDFPRVLKMCLVHDLGETLSGNVPAIEKQNHPNKDVQKCQLFRLAFF